MEVVPTKPKILELIHRYEKGWICDHELECAIFQMITPKNVGSIVAFLHPDLRSDLVMLARLTPRGTKFRSFTIVAVASMADTPASFQKLLEEKDERYSAGVFALKDYAEQHELYFADKEVK